MQGPADPNMMEEGIPMQEPEEAIRFEDLTVDDDLPVLDRVVRYTRSQIALQRLVHVKMMGETSEMAG
jgi:serine/threonine-protein phosphatase 4 regulatory subunit 1